MKCFANGLIRTMNEQQPLAEALVVDGDRLTFVGSSSAARECAGLGAEVFDLGGRLVLPGFHDCHTHFVLGGFSLDGINLRACRSAAAFVDTMARFAANREGQWITGGTWDHEPWENHRLPRREMIDHIAKNTPVFVHRLDGHMALANSLALSLAGVTRDTPDPPGGAIEKDPVTGDPTGILKDTAMDLVTRVIPKPSQREIESAVRKALREAARNGITTVHDISEEEHIPVFQKLGREGHLTCRIYARLPIAGYQDLVNRGVERGSGTRHVRLGSLKAFTDGSLGSNTALFFEPYENDPSTKGLAMEIVTSGDLRAWAIDVDRHHLQLSIHAIGDRANDLTLDLFEEIQRVNPGWDRRFRIEHAQHVRAEDFPRFARAGVIVSAQPYHCIDDGVWAEGRIGAARCATTYAFRSFLDAGVRVCFGSDWTVAPLSPLLGIYAAVTRATLDGKHPGGWIPDQKISVEEAIRCYTLDGSYASFDETHTGTLQPGKLADFIVLSEDIVSIDPVRIPQVAVEMTFVGGECVWV
jgi:predicted amidohydrolase YtcJ